MTEQELESKAEHHDDSNSDEENEQDGIQLSEKGKRMAASIAEYMLMRYFFPEIRDRRK